jgi:hypothetical protein
VEELDRILSVPALTPDLEKASQRRMNLLHLARMTVQTHEATARGDWFPFLSL